MAEDRILAMKDWYEPRSKAPPASDAHRPVAGRKDRKRWCGGHVGREHQYEIVLRPKGYGPKECYESHSEFSWWYKRNPEHWVCAHERVCARCGKNDWTHAPTVQECPTFQARTVLE